MSLRWASNPWANPCLSWGECALPSDVGGFLPSFSSQQCGGEIGSLGKCAVKSFDPVSPASTTTNDRDDNSVVDQNQNGAQQERVLRILDTSDCAPYKVEFFERELFEHDPGAKRRAAVIQTLRILGVKVFVIEALSIKNNHDLVKQVARVVKWTREENNSDENISEKGIRRCLLFEDLHGRLYNLSFTSQMRGPADKWKEYFDAFSTSRAISAIVILARSLPCLLYKETTENVRPLYFAIFVGLILQQETCFSEINASLLVRCTPSISAHMLDCTFRSDVPRHVVLLALTIAPAVQGTVHTVFSTIGLAGTCWLLLVNLGARSWHYMRLRGIRYEGYGQVRVASFSAAATGFCLPYLSHRSTARGGKQSVEHVIGASVCVAFFMLLTDVRQVTQYVVIGSQARHQDVINILLGCWWLVSLLCSLLLIQKGKEETDEIPDGEYLLVQDDLSPLGSKVPSLPDYEVDPTQYLPGQQHWWDCIASIVLALLVASVWAVVSYSEWGRDIFDELLRRET